MFDVAIIGGGPAGATAAMFTARAGLSTIVIDADKGITRRAMLHNQSGFPQGITGPEFVDLGKAQAIGAGAEWLETTATGFVGTEGAFTVTTEAGSDITAAEIILCVGVASGWAAEFGIDTKPATEPRIQVICETDPEGRTTVPGVWAAGIAGGASVHTVTTAGDGARVAINLVSARRGERYIDHDAM